MTNRWQLILASVVILAVIAMGVSLIRVNETDNLSATTRINMNAIDLDGYAHAIEPYDWQFPRDFGAHPEFLTEWWYYTGNVETETGRRFGYQFTIFRRAISPVVVDSTSEWRNNQVYLVHFTISDIEADHFYHDQRFSRAGAGLAGAQIDPHYRVWVGDWEVLAQDAAAQRVTLRAANQQVAVDLSLEQTKPPALQGEAGLSPKSEQIGNASYYYSLSRLLTSGTIRVGNESFTVTGTTWKDHEFSTSALDETAQGWDWFGLIFDDGRELMVGQIRLQDGGIEPAFGGLLIAADGSTTYLPSDQFTITVTDTWRSPHTDATYPAAWDVTVNTGETSIHFMITPLMADQELAETNPSYWEGAVRIYGDVTGFGYAELTGYVQSMANRF